MNMPANDPARKSYFSLPNEVFDDPYFTKEKRVLSRLEALAWIARHVRWTDNCVLKRGQGSWSLAYLAQAWGWARPRVQRFLKKLENMNILQLVRDRVSDTAQTVISYLISITSADAEVKVDTDPIQERYSSDTNIKTGNTGKKEDSCPKHALDGWIDPFSEAYKKEATTEPPVDVSEAVDSTPKKKGRAAQPKAVHKPEYTKEFNEFYECCPKASRRAGKAEPFRIWEKLDLEDRAAALRAAPVWRKRMVGKDPEKVPHISTWLNQRRWEAEEVDDHDPRFAHVSRDRCVLY